MNIRHHSHPGPARGIQLVVDLYPWSVLWVLLAVLASLAVAGAWPVLGVTIALSTILAWQSAHVAHSDRTRRGPQ